MFNIIIGNHNGEVEQTSVDNIYAIGDILEETHNLTPVAQKQGKFLAKKIFYKNMSKNVINSFKTKLIYQFKNILFFNKKFSIILIQLKNKKNITYLMIQCPLLYLHLQNILLLV